MKLLFLDIDGCLNGHQFDPIAKSNRIDPACVALLNRILAETDCRLVISSAWRYMVHGGAMTLTGFEYLLRTHGVHCNGKLVGLTRPDLNTSDKHERGRQITDWLATHDSATRYAVLDDDNEIGIPEAGHPFVQTDGKVGLTEADAARVIRLLNGE